MTKFTDYFNSTTIKGRANVAKATYASFAAIYLYSRFKKSKKISNENAKNIDVNLSDQVPKSEDSFKCPRCESNKDNKNTTDQKANKRHELHELNPPSGSCKSNQDSSTCTSQDIQDKSAAAAESMVKSSNSKSESGCSTNTTTINPSTITNEQKSLHSADDKELFWCYTV